MRYLPLCISCSSWSTSLLLSEMSHVEPVAGGSLPTGLFWMGSRTLSHGQTDLVSPTLAVPSTTLQSWAHLGCAGKWRARLWHRARTRIATTTTDWRGFRVGPLPGTQLRHPWGPWCRTSTVCGGIWPRLELSDAFGSWEVPPEWLSLALISLVITSSLGRPAILRRGLFSFADCARRFNSLWLEEEREDEERLDLSEEDLFGVSGVAPGPWWWDLLWSTSGFGTSPTRTVCLPVISANLSGSFHSLPVILAPWIKPLLRPRK